MWWKAKVLMVMALTAGSGAEIGPGRAEAGFAVTGLRCDYASNPLGVDAVPPRLFWRIESSRRGWRQSAYRILVASSERLLAQNRGDLWDTGEVASEETIQIPYRGRPLRSAEQVFWKVRVWDQDGKPSAWSRPASWTMGLLSEADWQGRWITTHASSETLLLRREFTVRPRLKRALAYVSGLGHYELTLNGRKAGEDLLSPGWTKYDKTCLYDTFEVTPLLHAGRNAVGMFLANGMYNIKGGRYTKFKRSFGPLKAILHLRLEYVNGPAEVIGTDEQWRTSPGPITFSCVFGGEDHDARLEQRGWDQPGFDDSRWPAAKTTNGPGGALKGHSAAAPPIRPFGVLKPVSVRPLAEGVDVYDLGQNASLIPRIRVHGPAGSVLRIIPSELLHPDGSVDPSSAHRGGAAYWQYTLAGEGAETWFPRFFYHGCRYLQIERSPPHPGGGLPVLDALEGVVVHSASPPVGEFACSNDLFNRIRNLVRWAQRSNIVSVLTDCPHRERLGWLEQFHLNGPSLRYEFDLSQLFTKGMQDMADSQLENGLVPNTAPEYYISQGGFRESPEWGSAHVIVPWQQYEWTGDVELLRCHYNSMKRYVAYLGSRANGYILSHGLGDWYDLGPETPGVAQLTPVALTATAFYYYDAKILAQVAALLGKPADSRQYEELAARIREAFNRKFFDAAALRYAGGSQTANSIPLVMGLVEPGHREAVLESVVKDVRQRGDALTAGDVGYRYLLRALADGRRSEVIFDMNNQSEKPGYGYQLRMGATSLTEAWNADPRSSQNHFMLGQIIEWFYHDLAGIGGDPSGPGFRRILIRPEPVGDLTWVRASLDSIRGKIISHWKRSGAVFELSVTIPANTTATVYMPAAPDSPVTIGGHSTAQIPGVRFLRREDDRMVYVIPSGEYVFQSRL